MNKWLKRALMGLGSIVGLIAMAFGTIFFVSESKMNEKVDVQVVAPTLPTGADALAEGKRLFLARGCGDCHAEDGAGTVILDAPPIGTIVGTNVTKTGAVKDFSDADWTRAIRYGRRPDGTPIKFMPANEYWFLTDRDLGAIVAYAKTLPGKSKELPETSPGPIGRLLYLLDKFPMVPAQKVDLAAKRPPDVPVGPTAAYGKYLGGFCTGCHGETLSGGRIPGTPDSIPVPLNITPDKATGIGSWSYEDFDRAMRKGIRKNGTKLDAFMPSKAYAHLADDEVKALWEYLQTEVKPKVFGGR